MAEIGCSQESTFEGGGTVSMMCEVRSRVSCEGWSMELPLAGGDQGC